MNHQEATTPHRSSGTPAFWALIVGASLSAGLCSAGAEAAPTESSDEAVLYRETFPNDGDRGRPLADAGWRYYLGPDGWDEKDNPATHGLLNENPGGSPDLKPVASESVTETDHGFVVNGLGPNGDHPDDYWNQLTHYATNEWTLDLSQTELTAITFDLALSQPDEVRVTVQVDGKWYASEETFTAPPIAGYGVYGGFRDGHVTRTLSLGGAGWLPFGFKPGVTMSLDTTQKPVELPAGRLEGFGLMLQPTGFEAFDTYTLIGRPRVIEPE